MKDIKEIKELLNKKQMELILKHEINTSKSIYGSFGMILGTMPLKFIASPYMLIIIICIIYGTYKNVKNKHILMAEIKELESKIKIYYINCKHNFCKDKGYYLVKRNKKVSTNNIKRANLRKVKCLECDQTIELYKTDNPNWDFTYEGVEIDIESSHQKKKKR